MYTEGFHLVFVIVLYRARCQFVVPRVSSRLLHISGESAHGVYSVLGAFKTLCRSTTVAENGACTPAARPL